ncbi:ABC transporter permease, partial [Pseudomonas syringae]
MARAAVAVTVVPAAVFGLRPRAMSYVGLHLRFHVAGPVALATMAEMLFMAVNDRDLAMGTFVGFVACVAAAFRRDRPLLGTRILAGVVGVYAAIGIVIHLRNLPSIVVSLGMSFVWAGLAVLLLPAPGGQPPDWVRALMTAKPPFAPMAIIASIVIALVAHLLVMRSPPGVLIRGVGGTQRSVERAG